jgi:hypothetical protein
LPHGGGGLPTHCAAREKGLEAAQRRGRLGRVCPALNCDRTAVARSPFAPPRLGTASVELSLDLSYRLGAPDAAPRLAGGLQVLLP